MRINKLIKELENLELKALIVSNLNNIRYLSGFTGDTGKLLVTANNSYIIVDGRFTEQAANETELEIVDYEGSFSKAINKLLDKQDISKCGFESVDTTYKEYDTLKKELGNKELVPTQGVIEKIRMIKEKSEIKLIKKALDIANSTFEEIKSEIVPGITEKEIATEIEYRMKKKGADGIAFETVVASGKRSSLPHGTATDKKIEYGDAVVIDMGARYQGYCSDMTRTLFIGGASKEQQQIYDIVEKAQKDAIDAIDINVKCSKPCEIVIEEFKKYDLDKYFIHALGHGVGLDVHERPYISTKSVDEFQSGMIVAIEPGIYLPNKFGVRIEDMVVITE